MIKLSTVLAACLLTAGLAAPAAAAVDPASLRPAGTGTHCVSSAVPAGSSIVAPAPRCFGSFPEAISFATGGAVQLPAGATTVTQAQLDAGRARLLVQQPGMIQSVVLGISYWRTGYNGDTWTHTGSYGCDTDPDVDWQNTGPLGSWDNEISSAQAYSSCTGKYWALTDFNGASITTWWSDGVMNNAASSIQWS
jgi:hypothetical protein